MSNLENRTAAIAPQFGSQADVPGQQQQEAAAVVVLVDPQYPEATDHNAREGRMSFARYCDMQNDL